MFIHEDRIDNGSPFNQVMILCRKVIAWTNVDQDNAK